MNLTYAISRWIGMIPLRILIRIRYMGFEEAKTGPYILACNHISHFDPPLLVAAMPVEVDFMGMKELFQHPVSRRWMTAVGVFPVDRAMVDTRSFRETLRRLKKGRIVGLFPERGIRTGSDSILEGAPLLQGPAAVAQLAQTKVRTCLIVGSDQLYDWKKWFQRPTIYICFGKELSLDPGLDPKAARESMNEAISASIRRLYRKLKEQGLITPELVPRSAEERWSESAPTPKSSLPGKPAVPLTRN